jgi:hypothetical protein
MVHSSSSRGGVSEKEDDRPSLDGSLQATIVRTDRAEIDKKTGLDRRAIPAAPERLSGTVVFVPMRISTRV